MVAILPLILGLIFISGIVVLQIFLSRMQSKWPGLILPALSLLLSVLAVLSLTMYSNVKTSVSVEEISGEIVKQEIISQPTDADIGEMILPVVITFASSNIPTVILLAIYFACRRKYKKNSELEKMNIQDLE